MSSKQLRYMLRRDGFAYQVTLHLIASQLKEQRHLFLGFDAFRDHVEPQRMRQRNDRLDDGETIFALRHANDETAIDFEVVNRKSCDVGERGIPGAEIIHRDLDTESAQGLQHWNDRLDVFHDDALSDLEVEHGTGFGGLLCCLYHGGDEIPLPKLDRRYCPRHAR